MRFSIIVPIYNGEDTLKQCVDSVLVQSFSDWELLLVNDGSTDGSPQLAEELAAMDNRIHVLHQENSGQFFAREAGRRKAAGEWLLFLDCDDLWEPHCLERLEQAITEHDPDCILFPASKVDLDGKLLRKIGSLGSAERWVPKNELYSTLLISHQLNSLCTKAFRRGLFDEDHGDYSALQGIHHGEDKIRLFHPLTRAERILYIPDPLYRYIRRPNTVSSISPEKIEIMMAREMFHFCDEYATIWDMDSPSLHRERTAYYLRHFLSVCYGLRRKCSFSYPWKKLLDPRAKARWPLSRLTVKEKLKLFLILILPHREVKKHEKNSHCQ